MTWSATSNRHCFSISIAKAIALSVDTDPEHILEAAEATDSEEGSGINCRSRIRIWCPGLVVGV